MKNFLILSSIVATLVANEFLSFEIGDRWHYTHKSADATIDNEAAQWKHFTRFGPIKDVWIKANPSNNSVIMFTQDQPAALFVDLDQKIGTHFNHKICTQGTQITAKRDDQD